MASDLAKRIPRLVRGVNLRALPLGALEGFVLSRIDGVLTVEAIALLSALDAVVVGEVITGLVSQGAAAWTDDADSSWVHGAERRASIAAVPGAGAVVPELADDVDLDLDRRRQIRDAYERLDTANFYGVLGLSPDADKQAIREAYFRLSRVFHPDTMFRKRLGSYKPKMEAVFRRLTEAYEVLGKAKTRAAYDEYLVVQSATQVTQQALAEGEQFAAQAAAQVGLSPPQDVPVARRAHTVPPPPVAPASTPPPPRSSARGADPSSSGVRAPTPETHAASPTPARSPAERPAPTDAQRRRALELQQLRMRGLARLPGIDAGAVPQLPERGAASARPPSQPPRSREAAREVAGRGLVQALQQAAQITGGTDVAARHLADGLRAERDGKLVAAVNALSLAHAVAPEREDVARELARLRKLLSVEMADSYVKQADYEERNGKWGQAALSWARVCEGRPDDREAHRRTGEAMLRSNGDLRRARSYAQRAVELAPDDAAARTLLGRVFIAAGLPLNARRELEHAAKLDPGSEVVKNLLRELR